MNIKFHCSEESNFERPDSFVRAFTYTEYSIEPHNHDFYEMNIVMGGTGCHQIETTKFSVKKGDGFVIPPMTVHAYYNTDHLEVYHILLKKDFVMGNQDEAMTMPGFLQLVEIEPFLRQNCSESMFLHLNPAELSEIEAELKFIAKNGAFDQGVCSSLHRHTTWKILYYLSFLLHKQNDYKKMPVPTKYRQEILDTLEYLHQNFSEKITIDRLADRVYLSRSTFTRSFQAFCSCSPIQYLTKYRMKKAMELLGNSTMSKTEIAHFCGFYDLSHMERSIKTYGLQP
jgi:AraC-like DNA-binding protein